MSNDNIDINILRNKIGDLENWRAKAQIKITHLQNRVDALSMLLSDTADRKKSHDRPY